MSLVLSFAIATLASLASAHGTVTGIVADGTYYGGYKLDYYYMKKNGATPPAVVGWSAENLDNGFVDGTGYQSDDINCHKNAAPGQASAKVAASGSVDFQWSDWPESHIGPLITYMANCNGDCASADKTALQWVKIDASGLDNGKWAAISMIANNNTWTTKIPASIAPGNYVLRNEIIALHSAGTENGAQNYPQCVNVEVTGSGTDALTAGTLGTALYKNTDEGILYNPYAGSTSYKIPGPALYSGAGGEEGNNPAPSGAPTSAATVASTSMAAEQPSAVTPAPVVTTASPVAPAISAIEGITSIIPSGVLTSAIPTPTPGNGNTPPSKPIPEGVTIKDLLDWLTYLLKNGFQSSKARRHARDIVA